MYIRAADLAIILIYLAGVTWFGAHFRRSQRTLHDYFLSGRTAPWWAIACSIVATETSTLTIIGTPSIAYGGNLGLRSRWQLTWKMHRREEREVLGALTHHKQLLITISHNLTLTRSSQY